MTPVRILLVDDHPVVREGYRRLLERQAGFQVCAEAEDAMQAYCAYKDHRPDVAIMDIALPGASGLEAVRHIYGSGTGTPGCSRSACTPARLSRSRRSRPAHRDT
ncbi:hypothetical protein BRAS3843_1830019 [Bradyrhizobium sp. STM 3843]|nr:hypothetical protein BRAS3843_1830019 [Bradyrhizobium sp. STM 3843]